MFPSFHRPPQRSPQIERPRLWIEARQPSRAAAESNLRRPAILDANHGARRREREGHWCPLQGANRRNIEELRQNTRTGSDQQTMATRPRIRNRAPGRLASIHKCGRSIWGALEGREHRRAMGLAASRHVGECDCGHACKVGLQAAKRRPPLAWGANPRLRAAAASRLLTL